MSETPLYRRVLLKLSGHFFQTDEKNFILDQLTQEIFSVHQQGVEIGIVIGGGNFSNHWNQVRIPQVTRDHLGILATCMNALILREYLEKIGLEVDIFSSIAVPSILESYSVRRALACLKKQHVVIFSGGTGNPLVTTDSAASLRCIEIGASALLKGTRVDGIYSADPKQEANAFLYRNLSYRDVLHQELGVMDLNAFLQCRDHHIPIHVFNMRRAGALHRVLCGLPEGTLVTEVIGESL